MKTILHVIDTTGPGGAETVFIDLVSNLSRNKYRPVVVIRGKGWVHDTLCESGVDPVVMDAKGSFNWRYLSRLVSLIRREKVDLVHSHLLGSNVYGSIAGMIARKPVVATFHGSVDIAEQERLKGLKFSAINAGASTIVTVSASLRNDILDRTSLRAGKIRVIYNGIKTADYLNPRSDRLRREYGWPSEDIIIGSLGNLRPSKAYDVLVQAANLLKDSPREYRFLIAGQGKSGLYDELLQLRNELGLQDSVHFPGFVDRPAEFLSGLDMYLLSSRSEGFSIATIQAMAAGLPVVATRSGGPEEIITHGENGWLVEPGNPHAIADALEMLAADNVLCRSLSMAGKAHVTKTFGMETMLSAYEDIYEELIRE